MDESNRVFLWGLVFGMVYVLVFIPKGVNGGAVGG